MSLPLWGRTGLVIVQALYGVLEAVEEEGKVTAEEEIRWIDVTSSSLLSLLPIPLDLFCLLILFHRADQPTLPSVHSSRPIRPSLPPVPLPQSRFNPSSPRPSHSSPSPPGAQKPPSSASTTPP